MLRVYLYHIHKEMFISTIKNNIPSILTQILEALHENGAKPILVGGCVRDFILKKESKDFDIEVFNISTFDKLQKILENFGSVKLVGKSFGVLILNIQNYSFDFALPRTEKKTGKLHTDFEVISDSSLSFKDAAIRRDFTINSIGYDYFKDEFLDPFGGLEDIKNKKLKHINDKTFVEDPLRVYRALQFASRLNFKIDEMTVKLCKQIVLNDDLKHLAKERVFEELNKLFLKSAKPSIGLEYLRQLGCLKYFPELECLIDCIQDKEYHPEGDVWIHTLMTVDELAKIIKKEKIEDEYRCLVLYYGILCHDFGKPYCTEEIKGKITSYKHEVLGIEPTVSFLSKFTNEKKFIDLVCALVKNHLAPFQLYLGESSLKAVKRLSLKVNIEDLCLVCLADCLGRDIPNKDKCHKAVSWLLEKAEELNIQNEPIKPIVLGRDLITLGLKPSKKFKEILDFAFDLQIDENMEKENIILEVKKNFKV